MNDSDIMALYFNLFRLKNIIENEEKILMKQYCLSKNEILVLTSLSLSPSTMKDLSLTMRIDKSSITKIAKRLEAKALIQRDGLNKRGFKLHLTEKGTAFMNEVRKIYRRIASGLAGFFKKEEIEALSSLKDKLYRIDIESISIKTEEMISGGEKYEN